MTRFSAGCDRDVASGDRPRYPARHTSAAGPQSGDASPPLDASQPPGDGSAVQSSRHSRPARAQPPSRARAKVGGASCSGSGGGCGGGGRISAPGHGNSYMCRPLGASGALPALAVMESRPPVTYSRPLCLFMGGGGAGRAGRVSIVEFRRPARIAENAGLSIRSLSLSVCGWAADVWRPAVGGVFAVLSCRAGSLMPALMETAIVSRNLTLVLFSCE